MAKAKGKYKGKGNKDSRAARRRVPNPTGRLAALETRIGLPNEVQDFIDRKRSGSTAATAAHAAFSELRDEGVAHVTLTDVLFDLDTSTKLNLVRVSTKDGQEIVSKARPHGSLKQQIVGRFVEVVIQIQGTDNDEAFVKVLNATPNIRVKGKDGPFATKQLFVTGEDT